MQFKELDVAQTIDISQPPFRRGILDYSHLESAEILDAVASSVLLWGLTAILLHVAACMFGMTTRALVVRSFFERIIFPDDHVYCKQCEKKPTQSQRRYYRTSLIAAFLLIIILLLSEAFVIIASSRNERYISFEELKIRKVTFAPYFEDVLPVNVPLDCIRTLKSVPSVTVSRVCVCGTSWCSFEKSIPPGTISLSVSKNSPSRSLEISSQSGRFLWGWILTFEVHPDQQSAPAYFIDPATIETNVSALLSWAANHIGKRFACQTKSEARTEQENLKSRENLKNKVSLLGCTKGNDEDRVKFGVGIVLGSLQLSDAILHREDFSTPRSISNNDKNQESPDDYSHVWDRFAKHDTTLIPGYVIWLLAAFFLLASLLLSGFVPDLHFAKVIAASQHLCLEAVPSQLQKHSALTLYS